MAATQTTTALDAHRSYLQEVRERQRARRAHVACASASLTPARTGTHRTHSRTASASHARTLSAAHDAGPSTRPLEEAGSRPMSAANSGSPANTNPRSLANVANYVPREEAVRNDYAAWYACSGQWPSNYVLGAGDGEICEEFPALRRLMDLKAAHVACTAHPPLIAPVPSASASALLSTLAPHRFDVVLLHDPRSWGGSWADIAALPIRHLSADPAFVFLWVGAGDADGLERGRECLAKWGFRRAEDIVWVKTNKDQDRGSAGAGSGLFASQKEHCLMGIRGTVRRSTDVHFVHCNVDTDVIVWEGAPGGPRTPPYLYTLIENFCLGARRLELFGDATRARPGWVTVPHPNHESIASTTNEPHPESERANTCRFDAHTYPLHLPRKKEEGKPVVPFQAEIEMLRPKSPQRRGRKAPAGGTGGHGHGHGQGGARFGPGVMRMGALTPAQNMAFQPMGMGMPQGVQGMPMLEQMAMLQMQMGQMGQGVGMGMGGMGMPGMGMGMGGMGGMGMGGMAMGPMGQGMLDPVQQHMLMMGMGMGPMGSGMPGGMGSMGMGPGAPMGGVGVSPMGGMSPQPAASPRFGASAHLASPHLASPHLVQSPLGPSPHLASAHLGQPPLAHSPHLGPSPRLAASPRLQDVQHVQPGSPDPSALATHAHSPSPVPVPVDEWGNPIDYRNYYGYGYGYYGFQ